MTTTPASQTDLATKLDPGIDQWQPRQTEGLASGALAHTAHTG